MFNRLRNRAGDERGFTLMELLIVIIILGVLVAVSVPVYLNQQEKATDAGTKADVRGAQVAAEILGSDNDASYATISQANLATIEPTVPSALSATPLPSGCSGSACTGYTLTLTVGGGTFNIVNTAGVVTRTCSGGTSGCSSGSW